MTFEVFHHTLRGILLAPVTPANTDEKRFYEGALKDILRYACR
jgi:hypothetical protein